MERPIDTTIDVVTPENIAFQYELAGPFRRALAFGFDLVVRLLILAVILIVLILTAALSVLDPILGLTLLLITWFLLEWFYGGIFEAYWNGQTPGKRILRLRVLQTGGQPITGLQAIMRNILRIVDMMPLLPLQVPFFIPWGTVGLVSVALTARFQRLGDLVCGTMVVVESPNWLSSLSQTTDRRVLDLAFRLPPMLRLSRQQARAVAAYVDRRRVFSIEHRREMARHFAIPLAEQWGLPADTDPDLLLCAVYHRAFITDQEGEEPEGPPGLAAGGGGAGRPGEPRAAEAPGGTFPEAAVQEAMVVDAGPPVGIQPPDDPPTRVSDQELAS